MAYLFHEDLARVAKLVDAPGLGPDASNGVGVRVPPRAPHIHGICAMLQVRVLHNFPIRSKSWQSM
jgi:hypothetical protein